MSSSKSSTSTKSLAKKLSSLTKTASALSSTAKTQGKDTSGIDSSIARSKAMVASAKSDNYSGKTSFKGSKEEKAFLASNIGTESPVIPEKPVPTDIGDTLGMNNASVLQEGLTLQGGQFVKDETASDTMNATKEANMNLGNIANSMISYLKPEAKQAQNAYEDTYGITAKQAGRDFRGAQNEVQQYTSQLNNITASRDAAVLGLEDTGRGQTSGFIGGEQGRIQRQAAIAALPVQAQLAAAQGNLEIAKSHVDSLFQMKVKDIETEQAYKNTVANTWMSVANQQQSNLLNAAIADSNARAEAKKTAMNDAKQIAMQAIEYGQSSLAASVMKLDPSSKTYQQDVMNAMGGLRKPVAATSTSEGTWSQIDDGNGGKSLLNNKTGEVKPLTGDANTDKNIVRLASAQSNIDTIDSVLKNPALSNVVGTNFLSRAPQGFFGNLGAIASVVGIPSAITGAYRGATGESQNLIGSVAQLQSQLTLDSLVRAKQNGATFGALSEGEMNVLSKSATKLGSWATKDSDGNIIGYNTNEKSFKEEMDKINNFAKIDFLLKGGAPEDVGVITKPDGTYWALNSNGTYTQLQ